MQSNELYNFCMPACEQRYNNEIGQICAQKWKHVVERKYALHLNTYTRRSDAWAQIRILREFWNACENLTILHFKQIRVQLKEFSYQFFFNIVVQENNVNEK